MITPNPKFKPQVLICTPAKRICYQHEGSTSISHYCGNKDNDAYWWCILAKGHDGAHVGCHVGPEDKRHNVFIWESK